MFIKKLINGTVRILLSIFGALFSALSVFAQVPDVGDSLLAVRLDSLVEHCIPPGSNVGICAYDLTGRKMLYSYQADKLSRPASTMKLLTAITALSQPGADEPFRTEVWYKGKIEADTLHGDLYVVGGFDPEFTSENLDSLVAVVARLPFSVINGKIYGDVSMKDSLYWGKGWMWDDNPAPYQPYLSPLMLNKGVVTVVASHAGQREAAHIEAFPPSSYYTLTNNTVSLTPSAGPFRVTRDWLTNSNSIFVTGNVDKTVSGTVNMYASQDFFMHTFVERLEECGINVPHGGYSYREFLADSLSVEVAVHETPVQDVLEQLMKESDNLNAEAMLCRLGRQYSGEKYISASDALDAVRALVKELGYTPADYRMADGCGLSNYNYISPELLVAFLRYSYSHTDIFRKLYKSLPIGGIDGTLKHRMSRGTPSYGNVHAKTGSYTGINCLAGYLKTDGDHWVAFAIMNQNVLSGRKARNFQDAVCNIIIGTE